MEFKQIEAFINVVKYKSFSKAADASFLTQPTISTHISSLEGELGVTLIDRMGKESRLTKQGREFYKYAINMINTREQALYAMEKAGKEVAGGAASLSHSRRIHRTRADGRISPGISRGAVLSGAVRQRGNVE